MIFKLNYPDKQTAIADLIDKKIIDADFNYLKGTHAVVEIGKVVSIPATFDENGELLTEPIYYDGYAYDVMSDEEVDFGSFEIFPKNPAHGFSGL
jgi:hypothetical protein